MQMYQVWEQIQQRWQKSNMGMNPSVNAGGGTQTGLNIGIGGELNKSAPHIPASTVMCAIYHGSSTDVPGIPAAAGGAYCIKICKFIWSIRNTFYSSVESR